MRIIGATDYDVPGYQVAHFEDGSSQVAPKNVVSNLLEQQGGPAPNRLAGAVASNDFGPQAAPQAQPVLYSQDPGIQAPQQPMSRSDAGSPPMGQPEAPRALQGEQAPQQGAPRAPDPYQQLAIEALSPKYVGGRAAYDPEKDDASRRAVHTGGVEHVQGATPVDWNAVHESDIDQRLAQQTRGEAAVAQANSQYAQARKQELDQQAALAKKEAEQRQAELQYQNDRKAREDEAKAVANRKVDPGHYLANMGTDKKIAFIIGTALSSYGTHGQSTNQSIKRLDDAVQNDIATQQNEIARAKSLNENALGRLSQQYGSLEAGKAALEAQQFRVTQARVLRMAAETGVPQAQEAAKALALELDAKINDREAILKSSEAGQISRSVQFQNVAPQKATAGGYVPRTFEEKMKRLKSVQDYQGGDIANESKSVELQNLRNNGGVTPEIAARMEANAAERAEHLGKATQELAPLINGLDQVMGLAGISVDKNGNAKQNGVPGVGFGFNAAKALFGDDVAMLLASEKGQRIQSSTQELITNKIKEASGAAFSEKEAERHSRALGQAWSAGPQRFAQAVVDFKRTVNAKLAAVRAGAGKRAVEMYDENYKREAGKQGALDKFEPVTE